VTIRVPLFDLDYGPEEEAAVLEVLRSKWLTMGDRTAAFEHEFAERIGGVEAVAVANCTAALHLAVKTMGVGPGDEVILPDLTFVATANAVLYEGATPVFADIVGAGDLTVDPSDVAAKVTPRTKAVIVMHYAGFPCDMDAIGAVAREHGFAVIEDAAHAPGASYAGRPVGALGDVACFSFFSNKNLSTGEGGMLTTADADVAARVCRLRSHAMTAQTVERHKGHAWGYDVVELGYNYRLTEIEAALGSVQLSKLEAANARRAKHVRHYRELLAGLPGVDVPFGEGYAAARPRGTVSAHHIMSVLLPAGADRLAIAKRLAERGIQTSVHYRPLHTFSSPALAAARAEGLDKVEAVAGRLLTLPLYPTMTAADVELVVGELGEVLAVG
jgi:dTDP-4-amino-4,6-dideoxygalactose transaminase